MEVGTNTYMEAIGLASTKISVICFRALGNYERRKADSWSWQSWLQDSKCKFKLSCKSYISSRRYFVMASTQGT